MAKNIKRTILSDKMPNNKHIMWAEPKNNNINLKIYKDKKWVPIGESIDDYINIDSSISMFSKFLEIKGITMDNIHSDEEFNTLRSEYQEWLTLTSFITEDHGIATFVGKQNYPPFYNYYECEDGSIIVVEGFSTGMVQEFPSIPKYIRFLLITDSYSNSLTKWGNYDPPTYYIVDTKNTKGKITEEVFYNAIENNIPNLKIIHNNTDIIYIPEPESTLMYENIQSFSNFFKLHWVNPEYIGIPSEIQNFVDYIKIADLAYLLTENKTIFDLTNAYHSESSMADGNFVTRNHGRATLSLYHITESPETSYIRFECSDGYIAEVTASGTEFIVSSPKSNSLKGGNPTLISVWKTTVLLSNGNLAYIFMNITDSSITISDLKFSDKEKEGMDT